MTPTDDVFWAALVARLVEIRWSGSPSLAAGLLPRHPQTGSTAALPGPWRGEDARHLPRTLRADLFRRIRG